MKYILTILSGALFSSGLIVSGMVDPSKVLGFLDIFGEWDARLGFVMAAAVFVTFIGYRFVLRNDAPLFEKVYILPSQKSVDAKIVFGAILFGIGWGLIGLCPGPALVAIVVSPLKVAMFVIPMLIGMFATRLLLKDHL